MEEVMYRLLSKDDIINATDEMLDPTTWGWVPVYPNLIGVYNGDWLIRREIITWRDAK